MSPGNDEGPSGGALGLQGTSETKHADFATEADCRARVAAADKVFQTWRARFAMAGWALYVTATDGRASFVVTRWGQVREFDTMAEVQAFALQVGVPL